MDFPSCKQGRGQNALRLEVLRANLVSRHQDVQMPTDAAFVRTLLDNR